MSVDRIFRQLHNTHGWPPVPVKPLIPATEADLRPATEADLVGFDPADFKPVDAAALARWPLEHDHDTNDEG